MPLDHTGLLIIRAWVEQGSLRPLRAQIRLTTDVSAGFERELTLADVDAVCAAVETWLRDLLVDGKAGQITVAPLG
jgi:hypothetical protein